MIAVFAAMRLEVEPLLRRLEAQERRQVGPFLASVGTLSGRPLLVCCTGAGPRAGEAAASLLDAYAPEAVLSVGLGGALSPECRVGDIVLGEWVHRGEPGASGPRQQPAVRSDGRLLARAQRGAENAGLRHWTGGSLTMARVVGEREDKAALRLASGLDVVEMESYWVGRAARDAGVPFLAVRAISDGADERLPEIPVDIGPQGELRVARVLLFALSRPVEVPVLLRTAVYARRAVRRLTRFLEAFLEAFEAPLASKSA
ncbi:MAG TPA: hypothetical protein VFT91_09825 [Dehalococcoidia bacterium]|nr:hypothetical protein [Dehalococcoidia bacterium]